MNIPEFYKLLDITPSEEWLGVAVLAKHAWCHNTQQRLYHEYKKKHPELTSLVITNYSVFPDYSVVVTFSDGARLEGAFSPDYLAPDPDSVVYELIGEWEIRRELRAQQEG